MVTLAPKTSIAILLRSTTHEYVQRCMVLVLRLSPTSRHHLTAAMSVVCVGSQTPSCSISCKVPQVIAAIKFVVGIKEVKTALYALPGATFSACMILVMQ